jgi:E3 ubiquitin-protein ligase HECTD4
MTLHALCSLPLLKIIFILFIQTAPEMFPYEEIPVTETKVNTDIQFTGAAFLVISCRMDPKSPKKE